MIVIYQSRGDDFIYKAPGNSWEKQPRDTVLGWWLTDTKETAEGAEINEERIDIYRECVEEG